jgi:anti-sigma factor RsiW
MSDKRCAEIREMLPAYSDDPGGDLFVRRHLAGCAACRKELASYEGLRADLAGLAFTSFEPPAELLPILKEIPSNPSSIDSLKTHVRRNRSAYLRGAAVLVAGAAGAAVWRSRRRLATA